MVISFSFTYIILVIFFSYLIFIFYSYDYIFYYFYEIYADYKKVEYSSQIKECKTGHTVIDNDVLFLGDCEYKECGMEDDLADEACEMYDIINNRFFTMFNEDSNFYDFDNKYDE